jgi:hypothetical protein
MEKGTDIGFNLEEIKNTLTEDLLTLRQSVFQYLRSKKLKKRNANFMNVFIRINVELKARNVIIPSKNADEKQAGFVKVEISPKRTMSASGLPGLLNYNPEAAITTTETFLKRKLSTNAAIEVEIPSFLNDKKQKISNEVELKLKKKNEGEKPVFKSCVNGKLY